MSDSLPLVAPYQGVVQEKPGLVATIGENGDVLRRHPDLGTLFVSLNTVIRTAKAVKGYAVLRALVPEAERVTVSIGCM